MDERKQFLTLIFTKKGDIRYISHLDLMRLFTRAVRRADLPVKLSEGFNPRYMVSIMRALKLGIESEHEEIKFRVVSKVEDVDDFCKRLQRELPEGIMIKPRICIRSWDSP